MSCNHDEEQSEYKEWQMQQRWETSLPLILERTMGDIKVMENSININVNDTKTENHTENTLSSRTNGVNKNLHINNCKSEATVNLSDTIKKDKHDGNDEDDNSSTQNFLSCDNEIPANIAHITDEMKHGSILALFKYRKLLADVLGDVSGEVMECGNCNNQQSMPTHMSMYA